MTPDKRFSDSWPLTSLVVMATKDVFDNLSHKGTIALGVAIISALMYWGFNRTFNQIDKIDSRQIEVIKNQGEMKNEFNLGMGSIKTEVARIEQEVKDHIGQDRRGQDGAR